MSQKPKNKLLTRQQDLMLALKISEEDVIANQNGQITDKQKKAVLERERYRGFMINILTLLVIGSGIAAIVGLYATFAMSILWLTVFAAGVLWGGAMFWGRVVMLRRWKRVQNEIDTNQIQHMQGNAIIKYGQNAYSLSMNNRRFTAPQKALQYIKHLEPIVIHYLPSSRIVLSIELLEE